MKVLSRNVGAVLLKKPKNVRDSAPLIMSTNVKRNEAMSDEIITAMSRACGASIFLFELFKNKPRKHLNVVLVTK